MNFNVEEVEKILGVSFNNKGLLKQAFIHRSFLNENKNIGLEHNERLEFLGDAVLELVITHHLYEAYPDKTEGDMTSYRSALVNADTCSEVSEKLGFNDHLLLSRGEAKDTGRARQYILANTLESVIGAIYLDLGYDATKKFIDTHITPLTEEIVKKGLWVDAKSKFQERAQDVTGITPLYKTLKEIGPDHDKKFSVGVFLGTEQIATGEGQSKQDAEQEAARKALENKSWN